MEGTKMTKITTTINSDMIDRIEDLLGSLGSDVMAEEMYDSLMARGFINFDGNSFTLKIDDLSWMEVLEQIGGN